MKQPLSQSQLRQCGDVQFVEPATALRPFTLPRGALWWRNLWNPARVVEW